MSCTPVSITNASGHTYGQRCRTVTQTGEGQTETEINDTITVDTPDGNSTTTVTIGTLSETASRSMSGSLTITNPDGSITTATYGDKGSAHGHSTGTLTTNTTKTVE